MSARPCVNVLPRGEPALANERRQRQQLARKRFRLSGANGAARFRAHRDELVVRAGHGAAIEIEPEAELGKSSNS